jgi:hypothetical protein
VQVPRRKDGAWWLKQTWDALSAILQTRFGEGEMAVEPPILARPSRSCFGRSNDALDVRGSRAGHSVIHLGSALGTAFREEPARAAIVDQECSGSASWTHRRLDGARDDHLGRRSRPPFNTGGHYDPGRNAWRPTETGGAPLARTDHTAVWTGREMIGIRSGIRVW